MSFNGYSPWDTTTNDGLLVPPLVYLQLKCKILDPRAVTTGRHSIVYYRAIPYKVDYEPTRLVFTPLSEPDPPWRVVEGFIVGSYVLEAYSPTGESLVMWDLGGQEDYRPGDTIHPSSLHVPAMSARKPKPPSDPPTHYSLAQVAIMFRCEPAKIKARCAKGDFDYIVTHKGRTMITRESILKHLTELEIKNNS